MTIIILILTTCVINANMKQIALHFECWFSSLRDTNCSVRQIPKADSGVCKEVVDSLKSFEIF